MFDSKILTNALSINPIVDVFQIKDCEHCTWKLIANQAFLVLLIPFGIWKDPKRSFCDPLNWACWYVFVTIWLIVLVLRFQGFRVFFSSFLLWLLHLKSQKRRLGFYIFSPVKLFKKLHSYCDSCISNLRKGY